MPGITGCDCSSCNPPDMYEPADCVHCGTTFEWAEGVGNYCSYTCQDKAEAADSGDSGVYVHNYSYTPSLNFLSDGYRDTDNTLFLGVELEVPTDHYSEFARSIYDGPGRREELLYCKEDGSIDGVEIVTHPMTHQYFRNRFPFEMFRRDSAQTSLLRQRTPGSGYGLHVHVSRAGFKNQIHALKWMTLLYRNSEKVEGLARRPAGQWSGWSDSDNLEEKATGTGGYERYVAINSCNDATFEVRVYRSTWNEQEFRAAVDFVHASVIYTRDLKMKDALDHGGLTWSKFREWLLDHPEYVNLTAELQKIDPMPVSLVRRRPRSPRHLRDGEYYELTSTGRRSRDTLYIVRIVPDEDRYVLDYTLDSARRYARRYRDDRYCGSTLAQALTAYSGYTPRLVRPERTEPVQAPVTPDRRRDSRGRFVASSSATGRDGEVRYGWGVNNAVYNATTDRWIIFNPFFNTAAEVLSAHRNHEYGAFSGYDSIPSDYTITDSAAA